MDFSTRFPQFEGINDRIRLLVLQGTPFCNLNCTYCYLSEEQRATKSKMSEKVIIDAAKFISKSGLLKDELTVLWHAGEPLTVPVSYYEKAIDIIESELPTGLKINYDFQTNAIGLNDQWCDFIKRRGIRIGVSIDGPAHIHDSNRVTKKGNGSFEYTLKGINKLKSHGIPFSTISVVTKESLSDAVGVISFLSGLEPVSIGFNIEEIEGANITSSITRDNVQLYEFVKDLYNWLDHRGLLNKCREFKSILRSLGSLHRPFYRNRQGENKAFSIVTIDQKGGLSTFSPELSGVDHHMYGDFTFGNVVDELEAVVNNKKFQTVFNDIERGIDMCQKECKYFSFCSGGSPSNKLMENGTFSSTDTQQCWFRKKVFADVVMSGLASGIFDTEEKSTTVT